MIQQTDVTLYGCRVWLEHNNKKTVKSASLKLNRFFKAQAEIIKEVLIQETSNVSKENQ